MFLLNWYQEFCRIRWNNQSIKAEFESRAKKEQICESCETLKSQLEIANYEKKLLLDRIMEKPAPIPETKAPEITRPKMIPWAIRRQMLEAEDRVKAAAQKRAAQPDAKVPEVKIEELEKELDIAGQEREEKVQSESA